MAPYLLTIETKAKFLILKQLYGYGIEVFKPVTSANRPLSTCSEIQIGFLDFFLVELIVAIGQGSIQGQSS